MSKTGGTTGTNQYQVRGVAVAGDITPNMAPWQAVVADAGAEHIEAVLWDLLERCGDLSQLASQPGLSRTAMGLLSAQPDYRVRVAVASNSQCPPEILDMLASDPLADVVAAVASNCSSWSTTVDRIAMTEYDEAFLVALNNPHCTSAVLEEIFQANLGASTISEAILANPNCPISLLEAMGNSHRENSS